MCYCWYRNQTIAQFRSTYFPVTSFRAREVQSHGLLFEKWLRDTLFRRLHAEGLPRKNGAIPAEANPTHGRIPVNPKAIKMARPMTSAMR